jgi:putative hydrolase of the HAD superfamily
MMPAKYVVWDFDGTLARRPQGWSGAVLAAIRAAGLACEARLEDVPPFLQSGYPWHEPDVVRTPGQHPDDWWRALDRVFVPAIGSLTGADTGVATKVAARIRAIYAEPSSWTLYDDALPALQAFAKAGWTQLVLSNHVPELPAIIEALGLGPYLARIFNSADTGIEKPNQLAYRLVLAGLPPDAPAWMIGDSLQSDVLAAEAAGMNAVLVRSTHPLAKRCCASLTEAFDLLRCAVSGSPLE